MTTDIESLTEWVRSDPVQAVLATAAYARMQVASYEILKTMAVAAGENSIASTCEECRVEQLEFAEWLDRQIPHVVMKCMSN